MKYGIALLAAFSLFFCEAQAQIVKKIEPLNWWNNMANDTLELMLYSQDIQGASFSVSDPTIKIVGTQSHQQRYAFVTLLMQRNRPAKNFDLVIKKDGKQETINYHIATNPNYKPKGFDQSDMVYLIMPDRFSNGYNGNDNVSGMEQMNRGKIGGRHGGDLQGITNHLDYIAALGATTIWLTPFTEMNDSAYSYHGYGNSNWYEADARYATGMQGSVKNNAVYKNFVDAAHKKGLKVIIDVVTNHIGAAHPWITDKPRIEKFIHDSTICNFQIALLTDPYATDEEKTKMEKGWFWSGMPDLDQNNPHLARYLVQNNIWWMMYAGLDGIRLDTEPFSDKHFLTYWNNSLKKEFPTMDIVGEVWSLVNQPNSIKYWQKNTTNRDGYNSNIEHVMDLPLYENIINALKKDEAKQVYYTISQDYILEHPEENFVLVGNHDIDRYYSAIGNDINKYKLGMMLVATTRGIPQLYYGDEFAMEGFKAKDDGYLRQDVPGGWNSDEKSVFTGKGYNLTDTAMVALAFSKKLWNWRKKTEALHKGKLMHYYPTDNVYIYKRYIGNKAVIVMLNFDKKAKRIDTTQYKSLFKGHSSYTEWQNGDKYLLQSNIDLPPYGYLVLEAQ